MLQALARFKMQHTTQKKKLPSLNPVPTHALLSHAIRTYHLTTSAIWCNQAENAFPHPPPLTQPCDCHLATYSGTCVNTSPLLLTTHYASNHLSVLITQHNYMIIIYTAHIQTTSSPAHPPSFTQPCDCHLATYSGTCINTSPLTQTTPSNNRPTTFRSHILLSYYYYSYYPRQRSTFCLMYRSHVRLLSSMRLPPPLPTPWFSSTHTYWHLH